MSPQIKNSPFGLYLYFKVSSRFLISRLKFHVGALYKLSILNLDASVSSSTAQISKSFSIQLCEISILLTLRSLQTKIHIPPFCRSLHQKVDRNMYPGTVRCCRSCSSMCSLKHRMWGFTLSISKEYINSSLLLLSPLIFY
jgi:hypothetical protein